MHLVDMCVLVTDFSPMNVIRSDTYHFQAWPMKPYTELLYLSSCVTNWDKEVPEPSLTQPVKDNALGNHPE